MYSGFLICNLCDCLFEVNYDIRLSAVYQLEGVFTSDLPLVFEGGNGGRMTF